MAKAEKRALVVYQGSYPWEVRIEKFCRTLCDLGFKVTLLCRWGGEELEYEERSECSLIRLGFRQASWKALPTSLNPLWRNAIERQVELLQPQLIVAREMLIATACTDAAGGRIPVLMDMAEHYPAAMRSWKKYRSTWYGRLLVHKLRLADAVEARAVRACDAIVGVCEENMQRVARMYKYPTERQFLVLNTPPLHAFDNVRQGSSFPAKVFSYQGYVTRERGVERCIEAFNRVASTKQDLRLLIAGSGESFDDVQALQRVSPVADRIELRGAFRHDELPAINSQTDVGLIAFDQDEFRQNTIPNKLFDYLLCAKPVIVSDCAPMARIVHEYSCGIVVDVNSPDQLWRAMDRMSQDDLSEMAINARKAAVERYHWEIDEQRLRDCILTLC